MASFDMSVAVKTVARSSTSTPFSTRCRFCRAAMSLAASARIDPARVAARHLFGHDVDLPAEEACPWGSCLLIARVLRNNPDDRVTRAQPNVAKLIMTVVDHKAKPIPVAPVQLAHCTLRALWAGERLKSHLGSGASGCEGANDRHDFAEIRAGRGLRAACLRRVFG